jgi:hypothetical protein
MITSEESKRFLELVQKLAKLSPDEIRQLNVQAVQDRLTNRDRDNRGIF